MPSSSEWAEPFCSSAYVLQVIDVIEVEHLVETCTISGCDVDVEISLRAVVLVNCMSGCKIWSTVCNESLAVGIDSDTTVFHSQPRRHGYH